MSVRDWIMGLEGEQTTASEARWFLLPRNQVNERSVRSARASSPSRAGSGGAAGLAPITAGHHVRMGVGQRVALPPVSDGHGHGHGQSEMLRSPWHHKWQKPFCKPSIRRRKRRACTRPGFQSSWQAHLIRQRHLPGSNVRGQESLTPLHDEDKRVGRLVASRGDVDVKKERVDLQLVLPLLHDCQSFRHLRGRRDWAGRHTLSFLDKKTCPPRVSSHRFCHFPFFVS